MATSGRQPPDPAPDQETKPPPAPALLAGITDAELAITMLAESDATAHRIARQICHDGTTQAERIAIYDFLHKIASVVRWPATRA